MILLDRDYNVAMSIRQVSQYENLGTWTFNSMYRTSAEKQKLCVKNATKYKKKLWLSCAKLRTALASY